jgi:hypothetical protein
MRYRALAKTIWKLIKIKKKWMTEKILQMMEVRRILKNDPEKYKESQKCLKREIRKAKEIWMKNQCVEIKNLERKHDRYNLHKKVKEAAGTYKSNTMGRLHDENDKIIVDKKEIMNTWRNYIEQLYEDISRPKRVPDFSQMENLPIMIEEVVRAIAQIKKDKSPGPDNIYGEFLKLIDEEGVSWLTKLFNRIYTSGELPQI